MPKQGTRWVYASSALAPSRRVAENSPEYGKRMELVTMLIDDKGQLWELVGRSKPVMLGTPILWNADHIKR